MYDTIWPSYLYQIDLAVRHDTDLITPGCVLTMVYCNNINCNIIWYYCCSSIHKSIYSSIETEAPQFHLNNYGLNGIVSIEATVAHPVWIMSEIIWSDTGVRSLMYYTLYSLGSILDMCEACVEQLQPCIMKSCPKCIMIPWYDTHMLTWMIQVPTPGHVSKSETRIFVSIIIAAILYTYESVTEKNASTLPPPIIAHVK